MTVKTDKPSAPDLVISASDIEEVLEYYVVAIKGKRYRLPKAGSLSLNQLAAIDDARNELQGLQEVLKASDEATRDAVGGLPGELALKVFRGWLDNEEDEPGESGPSEG